MHGFFLDFPCTPNATRQANQGAAPTKPRPLPETKMVHSHNTGPAATGEGVAHDAPVVADGAGREAAGAGTAAVAVGAATAAGETAGGAGFPAVPAAAFRAAPPAGRGVTAAVVTTTAGDAAAAAAEGGWGALPARNGGGAAAGAPVTPAAAPGRLRSSPTAGLAQAHVAARIATTPTRQCPSWNTRRGHGVGV